MFDMPRKCQPDVTNELRMEMKFKNAEPKTNSRPNRFFLESTPVDTNFGKVAVITYPDFGDLFKWFKCKSATQNIYLVTIPTLFLSGTFKKV